MRLLICNYFQPCIQPKEKHAILEIGNHTCSSLAHTFHTNFFFFFEKQVYSREPRKPKENTKGSCKRPHSPTKDQSQKQKRTGPETETAAT